MKPVRQLKHKLFTIEKLPGTKINFQALNVNNPDHIRFLHAYYGRIQNERHSSLGSHVV
jgi:hypothetical protein